MSKRIVGKIVSLKMAKTAVVEVEYKQLHPMYKKIVKRTKKLKAHSENHSLKEGDLVEIKEVRPLSKTKHWLVVKKVEG